MNAFDIKRAVNQLDTVDARSARNGQRVLNAGRVVFPTPIASIEIRISLRVLGSNTDTVGTVGDVDSSFAEPFTVVSALNGVDFHFIAIPGADVNVAVNIGNV